MGCTHFSNQGESNNGVTMTVIIIQIRLLVLSGTMLIMMLARVCVDESVVFRRNEKYVA